MKLWEKWCDFGRLHPHIATILVIIGIALFILLNVVFDFLPLCIAVLGFAGWIIYGLIYDMVSGRY